MGRYYLKEKHPARQAFEQLCELAEKLDINLTFYGVRTIMTHRGQDYDVQDLENPDYPMNEFPPCMEVKLTFEKDEDTAP